MDYPLNLKELYDIKEVDVIIGTKFKVENGFFARQMDGLNCKGEEKVRRLKEYLETNNIEVDYKNSYMFSDSLSDKPLLNKIQVMLKLNKFYNLHF